MIRSKINPMFTLKYMITENENKIFDRKSALVKPTKLANLISAFANAEGGVVAIGISDTNKKIEGINKIGLQEINNIITAPKDHCKPMPEYDYEYLNITNDKGEEDKILLLHIKPEINRIIETSNGSTFLRIGDRTKEMKGEDLRALEYSKNARHFEDELSFRGKLDDLDKELLLEYRKKINAEELDDFQVLSARGFIEEKDGEIRLTNAAILLFAKNIRKFYGNCRVRFVRYEGTSMQVGSRINIVKDKSLDLPIIKLIPEAQKFIDTQLREFTRLNTSTGRFETIPEYPEFAWVEGIVNAITHREYAREGNYILVSMYDDRLEIKSPGGFPNVVTVDNIRYTRFARNIKISRVLTEFGWVRELNEGVKRMFEDMEEFYLDPPEYTETKNFVNLVLKNNIKIREERQNENLEESIGTDIWNELDYLEKEIISYIYNKRDANTTELAKYTKKGATTIRQRIKKLLDKKIITMNGVKNDPNLTYSLKI